MVVQKIDTLAELQRQSGVSYDTIQKVLAGRAPNRKTLTKLAAPLGVTYNDLVTAREGIAATTPTPDLFAALERQTEAITALVDEVRASLRGVERGLAAAAKLREAAGSRAPSAPRSRANARQ